MAPPDIVLDTNVLVSGLRSRRGASFRLLQLVGTGRFTTHLSVALVLEYEAVLMRTVADRFVPRSAVDAILDYHSAVADHHRIHFLWHPFLRDPGDDLVLELAVAARAAFIVTHNLRDFGGVEQFGIRAVTPADFLRLLEPVP
jgi:putative PIN family toxin of toxin-antitoxin system